MNRILFKFYSYNAYIRTFKGGWDHSFCILPLQLMSYICCKYDLMPVRICFNGKFECQIFLEMRIEFNRTIEHVIKGNILFLFFDLMCLIEGGYRSVRYHPKNKNVIVLLDNIKKIFLKIL